MPEVDSEFVYLIEWIHELGFYESNGMGTQPISYQTIWAWSELMLTPITPFDVNLLREMSSSFIAMQEKAKDSQTPDPLKELNND